MPRATKGLNTAWHAWFCSTKNTPDAALRQPTAGDGPSKTQACHQWNDVFVTDLRSNGISEPRMSTADSSLWEPFSDITDDIDNMITQLKGGTPAQERRQELIDAEKELRAYLDKVSRCGGVVGSFPWKNKYRAYAAARRNHVAVPPKLRIHCLSKPNLCRFWLPSRSSDGTPTSSTKGRFRMFYAESEKNADQSAKDQLRNKHEAHLGTLRMLQQEERKARKYLRSSALRGARRAKAILHVGWQKLCCCSID